MTIHRIHHDNNFLTFEIATREVLNKLGREYPFHIDRSPIAYAAVWSEPLNISFVPMEKGKETQMPDICDRNGRLFLSSKAYNIMHSLLANDGEFLPVTYGDESGYIFNPLVVAEDLGILDESNIGYDQHGNLEHFSFLENKLGDHDTVIFRAKIDNYDGVFCTDKLKETVEKSNLTGIYFQPDLANFTGEPSSLKH